MIIHIIRAIYLLVVMAFAITYAQWHKIYEQGDIYVTLYIAIPALAALALVFLDMFWRKKRLQAISGLFFGLLAGLVIAYALAQIVNLSAVILGEYGTSPQTLAPEAEKIPFSPAQTPEQSGDTLGQPRQSDFITPRHSIIALIKVLLGASSVFLCVSFVLQTKDEFRFVIPYVEFSRQTKGIRPLLLDTSVIIDGRIGDIAETRILDAELIVPRFVLAELQAVADSDDKLKRNRGRRGMEVLNSLQKNKKIDVRMINVEPPNTDEKTPVDAKLVALAEHLHARLVTNDYNLSKIAQIRNVDSVNINDLANALRPVVLPGEKLLVKIIKPGEEAGQGIGYLEDGTMVVAEQARDLVGKEAELTITSVLQTSAGRMIFGKTESTRGDNRPMNS